MKNRHLHKAGAYFMINTHICLMVYCFKDGELFSF